MPSVDCASTIMFSEVKKITRVCQTSTLMMKNFETRDWDHFLKKKFKL